MTTSHPSMIATPVCPRCNLQSGLLLDRPDYGSFNAVYRCDGRVGGCGFLWSPA